ncbi:purine-nucleoside phosphorylase [Ohtaekwangia sp.]|uniref:purine-nucleoside phosphorylase n=1 Tax=Ohtaekwangia sp. TaxID=2066019 RepID=UPI002F920AD8
MIEQINEAAAYIKSKGIDEPEIGVVLGTGLGNLFVKQIHDTVVIDYHNIPHFPVSTVEFHKGRLVYGKIQGRNVLAMQGRFHYYEGYTMQQITFPVRVMKKLGVKHLLLSNAAGNMNLHWKKGELMLLDDHIHFQPDNPLRGINDETLGPRFPDMSQPYSPHLNALLISIAKQKDIKLNIGVYVSVMGPNLETRSEYRFLRRMGADAVGMSTVPEVIVANHMGLPCCAVSVLTDDCDPDNLKPVALADIIAIASQAEGKLTDLYVELIGRL